MDFHAITPLGRELLMSVVDGVLVIVPPGSAVAQPSAQSGVVCRDDNKHDGDERGRRVTPQVVPERPGGEGKDGGSGGQ